MNKIYKVIWNRVRHCYVVVSEITKNHGKEHSTNLRVSKGLCALTLAIGLSLSSYAFAADSVDLGNNGSAAYDANGNLTVGNQVKGLGENKKGQHNTAIGTNTDTLRNVTKGDTTKNGQPMDAANTRLVDGEGTAHKLDTSTESGGSTAVGYNNKAEGDSSTAIGNNAKIINKPVTYYADKDGNKTTSTDDAAWYKDSSGNPTQVPQVFRDGDGNTTTTPQYVHTYTEKDPTTGEEVTKIEITSDAAKADQKDGKPVYSYLQSDNLDKLYSVTLYQAASNSIAAGSSVSANGSNAVAVGYSSTADNSAVAVGDTAVAKENAVAIGKDTKANVEGSIALGKGSEADRSGGTIGWDPKTGTTSINSGLAWKSTEGALSVGSGSVSRQITGVAAGSEDTDAVNLAQLKKAMTHYYSVKTTAETDGKGNNNYLNDGATGDNALAAGVSAVATGDNATAVGTSANATASQATAIGSSASATSSQSTAIGYNAGAHGTSATNNQATAIGAGTVAPYYQSTAVGASANATAIQATAMGSSASATSYQSTAIGNNAGAHGDYATALGNGASATNTQATAIGSGAGASGSYAIAMGNKSSSTHSNTVAIGYDAGAHGDYATALGSGASATSYEATAIGSGAKANGSYAIAMGNGSSSTDSNTIAIGSGAGAHGSYAIALGNGSSASNSYSIAIGASALAPYYQATALGNGANATNSQATAIGSSSAARGTYATALGNGASAYSSYATALGSSAIAQSSDDTAIGSSAKANGGDATALGYNAQATAPNATALGSGASAYYHALALGNAATASSNYALAAGDGANAQSYQAIALGNNAKSNVTGGVALGSNSTANVTSGKTGLDPHTGAASTATGATWVSTLGAVSVGTVDSNGTATGTRQINGVAAGTQDTDAVNVAQLKAMETKINMHYYSVNSTLSGDGSNYDNTGATDTNAMAVGPAASATAENAVAIGYGAKAEGKGATVIGKNAKATGQYATAFGGLETTDKKGNIVNIINTASGNSSTAFGQGAQAKGAASLAFGHNTVAGADDGSGQQSVAFGEDTQALGGRSLAFGEKNIAKYNDSVAFGNDTRASSTGATAFGNRTRALSQYATAWGNATVAADEESTAWGTDTIAGAKLDENGAVTNKYTENDTNKTEQMDVHGNLAYTYTSAADNKVHTAGIKQMPIDSGSELHDYVVLAGKDGNTYVRDYQGSLWKVNVDADGNVTIDTTAGTNGKVYNGQKKTSLAKTTMNGSEVDITPDNVLTKAHEGTNGYNIDGYANATAFGYSTEASGDNATAFGNDTKAAAAGATAFGYKTLASGENSTAFGENSIAAAKNSLAALGGTTTDAATNAAAIGSGAKAALADSIALGSGALANRSSGSKGYDVLTGTASTNTSAAWVSNANAIAIGNDTDGSMLTRQITGVAAGSLDTDAVNVAQLKAAGFKVTTQNNGNISSSILNGDTLDFEAKDNAIVSTSKDSKTITVAVSKTPTFDSATFYNPNPTAGQNNEKVTIANGQISAFNSSEQKRAVIGVDNEGNGNLSLVNNDLSTVQVYTQSSKDKGNDDITRMYYVSSSGNGGEVQGIHTIAVLDDGINYSGDNVKPNTSEKVVVKHKLNSTMDVTGGADTNNLSDNNIGVVATPAVEDENGNITQKAKLEIKLNKDVTGLNTVTAGTAKIGHDAAGTLKTTQNGAETGQYADAGDYVTGLTNKDWTTKNPTYVSGRAATEDELATVSGDVTTNANNITNNATNIQNNADTIAKGLNFTTNTKDASNNSDNYKGYKVVNRKLGDTISIKAGDVVDQHNYATTNLTTEISDNGDITIKMDENPTFNVVTATSVNLSPKDNTTKDQNGKTASAQLDAHYRGGSLNPDKNVTMADGTTGMVRLHYHDGEGTIHDLATMDDGQVYAGDIKKDGTLDKTGFGRKMNEKTTINGGVTNKDNLSDNNIGVVSDGTSTLTVKLAKNLKDLQSVQAGKTTIDDKGLTIKKSDDDSSKNVVVLGDKVAFGDNQVNNMGSGASKITEDDKGNKTYEYNTLNNGANIGDVKNIANSTVQPVIDTVNKGWELDVNGTKQKAVIPDSPKVNFIQGQNITITGDKDKTENVTVATADDVRFNTVRVGGVKTGDTYSGGILIGIQSGKNDDGKESANSNDDYYITGLKNTNWDSEKIQHGRAATEDQLQAIATEIKNGTVKGDVYVTGGAVSYKGEGEGADPKAKDGTGSINLTRQNGTDVHIDGLHDYYVTGGTVTNDGKTLELTRNDIDDSGNPQKITVDLSNVLSNDLHLVQNPADGSEGKYKVDTTTGTVTLKVQNADGTKTSDITIGGFEGLGQGLKFGANKMAKDGGGNPVTNQLGSTIKITGAGTKELKDYSGKNLLTSVEQDDQGNTIVHVLMDKNISADGVTVGQAGKDGVAGADGEVGKAGTIGINGKNGVKGDDGKEGITTTVIHTEKGQPGENGATGKPGVDGKDITRIVYQNDQDKVDGKDGSHTVATLDDGLKFSGDDNTVIQKKLNEQLQFAGGADKTKLTENNIGINEKDGKLLIQLVENPNLGQNGNLTAGTAQIGHFDGNTLSMTKNGKDASGNYATAGSYATGLSNKEWNVDDPEYVSGRAATEDQLKKVSDAIGKQVAAKSDYQLVANDKTKDGSYTPDNGTLKLQVKDPNNAKAEAKTIIINDIASKSKVDEALDRTVKYDMKDGKVDKTHVTFEATDEKGNPVDTQVSHMASGASEITDDGKGHKTYVYNTDNNAANIGDVKNIANSLDAEVTKKGLNFKGNDGEEVHRDLGTTLNIVGGINDQKALNKTNGTTSSKNLGVRKSDDNSLEIVMTNTPDFEKVTIGKGTDMTQKIIIGEQTVTGKKADGSASETSQTGNYITGLDNKAWDKDNVVENRAATEGQLRDAINSVNGSVNKGFGLADEKTGKVTKALGETITIKGDTVYNEDGTVAKDGNIKTTVNGDAIQISLNDQISVGQKGADGQNGKDGKVTVETKGGTTVIIGHDGKDGDNGKDGLFVTGKDGKDGKSGVSITGPNGADGVDGKVGIAGKDGKDAVSITGKDGVGHIGLTGPKGEQGADGTPGRDGTSIDISTDYGTKTLDSNKNVTVDNKEQASRIIYNDAKGPHEVATMDDGLKIGANAASKEKAANPVSNKLNSTINIMGSAAKANHTYTADNLTTTVEQDEYGNTTVKVLMDKDITGNSVTVGRDGKDGKDGQEGSIGIAGKNGIDGEDGKQGITTTIIKTEKGQNGKDGEVGKQGAPGVDGKDITRIVYQNDKNNNDKNEDGKHVVATLDDGLKFVGDDSTAKPVTKKLNDTLQIRGDGTYDEKNNTVAEDGNIKTSVDHGAVKVSLSDKINLHQDGYLTVGGSKNGNAADGNDPIVIKHFDDKTLDVITGVGEDGKPITIKEGKAGDYVTGLDNKNWNVDSPTYVSGRAATEDQLKKVSDAVNKTSGQHTIVTVNDKDGHETKAEAGKGAFGKYAGTDKDNLLIAAKDDNGQMTYNIKLNDQLTIGQKGEPGKPGTPGKDGKVTVETKGGTTVVIGHDGEPGKDGKDGISVKGKDGKDGVTLSAVNGKDGTEGHIGLTGPKGADGKNANIDISTVLGKATLDRSQNEVQGDDKDGAKDQASRIRYQTTVTDKDGKTRTITHEVATMDDGMKYAGNFGDGASVKLNKTVTIKGKVKDGAKEDDFVDGNIAVVANKSGEDGELLIKLNKDLTGLNSAIYTTSTKNGDVTTTSKTVVDGTGLKIENGPSITNTGIDGGKHQIINVASGKDGNMYDTTVKGQENWNNAANIGDVTNIAKSAADGVQAKSGKNITVDANNKVNLNDNITLGDDKDKAKQVSINGNDAKITAGDGDNKVTVDGSKGQIVAGGDNGVKIGNIEAGDSSLTIYDKNGNATDKKADGGNYVTGLGNKTWNADGTGSYVSGRAATEDQLHQLESSFNTKVEAVEQHHTEVTVNGGDKPEKADGSYTKGNLQLAQTTTKDGKNIYDLKLSDNLDLGKAGTNGKDGVDGSIGLKGADGKSSIGLNGKDGISVIGADGKNGVSITGSNGLNGKDGIDGKIAIGTPSKDGQPGKDAISISGQNGEGHIGLTGAAGKDGKDAVADIHVKNGQVGVDGTDGHGGKEGMDRVVYEDHNGTPHEVATMDDGMKYGDDFGNTAKVKLNHQLDIVGDINVGRKDGNKATKDDLSDGNIGIIATDTTYNEDGTVKENGKMTVKLAKDLKGLNSIESNSVTTGNTTINNGGLTIKTGDENRNITVQDGNVNMGGNQIHNVAPGQAPGDAVNVSQLNATNYAVNKLGTRVKRVGAGAAALAALHPLDFDPDDKWDFAAGYGNYKDASAVAVGAYYRPNEDTMFSVGGSFGGGENMVNAGVSFKVGQGNHVSTSRVAMAKEIKDLRQDVANLNAIVNRQSALIDKLTGTNAGTIQDAGNDLFPDVPANHWAYEYVTKLKQAGILTGYPDGNFDGDRMMTRYEFAAIVYRAIMAGAASNPALSQDGTLDKLAKEFSPEMKHIRIDTIAKDKNGKPTIERVRVIPEAQQ